MRLHFESQANVAAAWLDAISLSGGQTRVPAPFRQVNRTSGCSVPGMALVVDPVCQVETIDEKAIADVELIERQRQGLRSRGWHRHSTGNGDTHNMNP